MSRTLIEPIKAQKFPAYLSAVKSLVDQHRKLKHEPLHLAIYYAPKRHVNDVFLLEVIDRFGDKSVDTQKKLFELSYGSTPGFPLPENRNLRLVLTNPAEFQVAAREKWKSFLELKDANEREAAEILYLDPLGRKLAELL